MNGCYRIWLETQGADSFIFGLPGLMTYVVCTPTLIVVGGLWWRQLLTTWRIDRRQAAFELKKGRQTTTTTTTSELAELKRVINDKSDGDVAVRSVARERQLSSFYRTSHTFTVLQPLMYTFGIVSACAFNLFRSCRRTSTRVQVMRNAVRTDSGATKVQQVKALTIQYKGERPALSKLPAIDCDVDTHSIIKLYDWDSFSRPSQ